MPPPITNIATRQRQCVALRRFHNSFGRHGSSNGTIGGSITLYSFKCRFRNCVSETKRFASRNDLSNTKGGKRGARPLYFQRSPRAISPLQHEQTSGKHLAPITPYDLLGTASMLPADARHLSPCLGAALASSPLAGNLMMLGRRRPDPFAGPGIDVGIGTEPTDDHAEGSDVADRRWSESLSRIGFLANNLFFRLIRESPVHMVRNKSMPAAHLTPEIIGCLLAQHQSPPVKKTTNVPFNHQRGRRTGKYANRGKNEPNASLKKTLKRDFGIKSNHIYNSQWTGISLARWMDLVIPKDHGSDGNSGVTTEVCRQSLLSAVWLIALWGISPSKESLSRYYEALDRSGVMYHPEEQHRGEKYRTDEAFTENDFGPRDLEAAMNRLLEHYSSDENACIGGKKDDAATARALELVCAAIILQQQPTATSLPPVVPNGYFTFDGGDAKADCAEVAVREILTLLLWDDSLGCMDVSRLPSTTSWELIDFFKKLNERHRCNADGKEAHNQGQEELGQLWFDLLSDLPHCDYLAKSPNGRAFELAPTSESISMALRHHLVCSNEKITDDQLWTSLQDLADFWCEQQRQSNPLVVKHHRLKHQSINGNGGPRIVEHELLSLHLHDNSRAIELRLRCDFQDACGMAAVTRLAKPRQEPLLNPGQVQELQEICVRCSAQPEQHNEARAKTTLRARLDPSLVMLCLALQSEYGGHTPSHQGNGYGSSVAFEYLSWLATPYGPDRRELNAIDSCTGEPSNYNHTSLSQSQRLLKKRILDACRICKMHPRSGAHLLSWILQESPIVVETSSPSLTRQEDNDSERDVERALLSLPTSVLGNDTVLGAIEWNWACLQRGRVLTRFIRWKMRKLTTWQLFAQSKIHELVEVASLWHSNQR